jgi:hypothetical protein
MFNATINICTEANQDTLQKVAYVVHVLNAHPLSLANNMRWQLNPNELPIDQIRLDYGSIASCNIPMQKLIFGEQVIDFQQLAANAYTHENQIFYSVEATQKPEQTFSTIGQDHRVSFAFDWLEMLFFHLSRVEEYHLNERDRDEYRIVKSNALFVVRHKIQATPFVDQLIFGVYQALQLRVKAQKSVITLTHDADHLYRFPSLWSFLKYSIKSLFSFRLMTQLPKAISAYSANRDPYHTYPWMLSKRNDIQKILYLPSGYFSHPQDPTFDHTDPLAAAAIQLAEKRGYVFGLHPRINSFKNEQKWNDEKAEIENQIGNKLEHSRQHFLQFTLPETAQILEKSGVKFDSSIGYRDLIGFRCGTGFPYALYHFSRKKPYSWQEIPLVVMDVALMRNGNMDTKTIEQLLLSFIEKNAENTQATFLFHNSVFQYARECGVELEGIYQNLFGKKI